MASKMNDKIKVMVAEDIDILRDNLVEMLMKEKDIEVVAVADSGAKIYELARKTSTEIILMDIDMETCDAGIVAATKIFNEGIDVKIIFLTVHEDDGTIIDAMSSGAVDYIIKTSDCKEAISHIRKAHKDKIELDGAISRIMAGELVRIKKAKEENVDLIKIIMLLTPSEREIIKLLLQNKKVNDIAKDRYVEAVTIKKQIGQLLKKFNAKRTKEVVQIIHELKLESIFE